MTAEQLQLWADRLRRRRYPCYLFRTMGWFRALDAEQRYQFEERIAIIVGDGPVTAEAFLIACEQIGMIAKIQMLSDNAGSELSVSKSDSVSGG